MTTTITEIAPDIYRLSTFVDEANLTMNQFLVDGEEPLLFHTGQRALFTSASDRTLHADRHRPSEMDHVRSRRGRRMRVHELLACGGPRSASCTRCDGGASSRSTIWPIGRHFPCRTATYSKPAAGRVRHIDTPHVPHGWDAGLMFEETTSTLFCGDLFTAFGHHPATTEHEIVGPALEAEDLGHATCLTPDLEPTIRALADLEPRILATMHASTYYGDCVTTLHDLADSYATRFAAETEKWKSD